MPHPNNHTTFYVDERVMYEDLQSHYVQATVIAIHEDVGGAYYTIITDDATTEKQTVGRRLQKLSNFTDPDTVNAVEVIREVIREKEKLYNETCDKEIAFVRINELLLIRSGRAGQMDTAQYERT